MQTDQCNSNIQKFLCYLAGQEIICAGALSVDGIPLTSDVVGICLQLPWKGDLCECQRNCNLSWVHLNFFFFFFWIILCCFIRDWSRSNNQGLVLSHFEYQNLIAYGKVTHLVEDGSTKKMFFYILARPLILSFTVCFWTSCPSVRWTATCYTEWRTAWTVKLKGLQWRGLHLAGY